MNDDYQLFYSGGRETRYRVGFSVPKESAEKTEYVHNAGERIVSLSMNTGTTNISVMQVYAPQQGRLQQEKDAVYQQLLQVKSNVPYTDNVIILGDLNGHVGQGQLE